MQITNLSIIIIAHNEEFAIKKSLEALRNISMTHCEVICVDSNSTDKTLEIAQSFQNSIPELRVLSLTGYQNASIARNAGIKVATRDHILFVDGDVELNSDFLEKALYELTSDRCDAVFGMLDDYEYNDDYSELLKITRNRTNIKTEEPRYLCGGIFMVKKKVVDDTGLFDENLVRCEDFDYTLRLTQKYRLKVIPVCMGNHHTIPYGNKNRMKNELKNGLPMYYGALLRKNRQNRHGCMAHIKRAGYLKGLTVSSMFILSPLLPLLLIPASGLLALDTLIGLRRKQDIKYRLFSHYIVPFYVIYGYFFGLDNLHERSRSHKH